MGARGRLASPDATGHRTHPAKVQLVRPIEALPAPEGLLAETRRAWDEFWSTPPAALVTPAHYESLRYLFELRDERARYRRVSRGKAALSKGSKGQEVLNPLLQRAHALGGEIARLEKEFGMTPEASRRLLGAGEGPSRPSLGDLLEGLNTEAAPAEDDPRLRVVQGGAG